MFPRLACLLFVAVVAAGCASGGVAGARDELDAGPRGQDAAASGDGAAADASRPDGDAGGAEGGHPADPDAAPPPGADGGEDAAPPPGADGGDKDGGSDAAAAPCEGCLIDGECFGDGAHDPADGCRYCDVSVDKQGWRSHAQATPCDDGLFCNGSDRCNAEGECAVHFEPPCPGTGYCAACDEGADRCLGPETSCDDGDRTTFDDACDGAGGCVGTAYCSRYTCGPLWGDSPAACYDTVQVITCPGEAGSASCADTAWCGQDAQYPTQVRTFEEATIAGQAVVHDSVTGLTWLKEPQAKLWQDGVDYCEELVVGALDDWRMPDRSELGSLADFGLAQPATSFPGIAGSETMWTSTRPDAGTAYFVFAERWEFTTHGLSEDFHWVRCVRGESFESEQRFDVDLETALDRATGLQWQVVATAPHSWSQALAHCEGLELAGHDDWRLPSMAELYSLPHRPEWISQSLHWSSTTTPQFDGHAYVFDFFQPGRGCCTSTGVKDDLGPYTMCVR